MISTFATSNPAVRTGVDSRGYFSSPDGKLHVVAIRPSNDSDEPSVIIPFVQYVERAVQRARARTSTHCRPTIGETTTIDRCGAEEPLKTVLTGLPALITDEQAALNRDAPLTSLVAAAAVLALFVFGFRSVRQGLLGLVPLAISLVCTLAFVRLMYGGLNMITAGFISTILGLGIDFSVHLLARFNEAKWSGEETARAIEVAVSRAGPGIITGALTTAGAFVALLWNGFRGFVEMGMITTVGLLLALIATLTLVPALVTLFAPLQKVPRPRREANSAGPIARAIVAGRTPLLLGGLVFSALMVWQASKVPWSYDYLALLPKGLSSVTGMATLTRDTDFSGEVAAMRVNSVEQARSRALALRKLPSVGRVESLASFVPEGQEKKLELLRTLRPYFSAPLPAWAENAQAARAMGKVDVSLLLQKLQGLIDSLEDAHFNAKRANHPAANALALPLQAIRGLQSTIRKATPEQAQATVNELQAEIFGTLGLGLRTVRNHVLRGERLTADWLITVLPPSMKDRLYSNGKLALYIYPKHPLGKKKAIQQFVSEIRTVDPAATGFPVTHWQAGVSIEGGFRSASLLAVGALLILLFIDFRSIRYTLLAVAPLGVGVLWMWGSMSFLGMDYNFANVIAFPLTLGIGIASGVHILHRYRQEGERNIVAVVQHTGMAIFLSAATTMAGFGSLALAQHQGAASLGVLLLVGVGACLVTATLLLPAVLQLISRK
jgi:predicted RND superfamily exporter protein